MEEKVEHRPVLSVRKAERKEEEKKKKVWNKTKKERLKETAAKTKRTVMRGVWRRRLLTERGKKRGDGEDGESAV